MLSNIIALSCDTKKAREEERLRVSLSAILFCNEDSELYLLKCAEVIWCNVCYSIAVQLWSKDSVIQCILNFFFYSYIQPFGRWGLKVAKFMCLSKTLSSRNISTSGEIANYALAS